MRSIYFENIAFKVCFSKLAQVQVLNISMTSRPLSLSFLRRASIQVFHIKVTRHTWQDLSDLKLFFTQNSGLSITVRPAKYDPPN